jgi:hypothetical protein
MSKFLHGPPKFSRGPPVGDRCYRVLFFQASKVLGLMHYICDYGFIFDFWQYRYSLQCPSAV